MPLGDPPESPEDYLAARVGGTAAGLLGGLAVGSVLAVLLTVVEADVAAGWVFFICTAGGAVAGYLSASAGLSLAEGVSHFLIGTVSGVAQHLPSSSQLAPRWLRWVMGAGVVFGVFLLVLRRW